MVVVIRQQRKLPVQHIQCGIIGFRFNRLDPDRVPDTIKESSKSRFRLCDLEPDSHKIEGQRIPFNGRGGMAVASTRVQGLTGMHLYAYIVL